MSTKFCQHEDTSGVFWISEVKVDIPELSFDFDEGASDVREKYLAGGVVIVVNEAL